MVYSDEIFLKSTLYDKDKKNKIVCTLSDNQGRFISDNLLRNEGKGFAVGNLVDPLHIPNWLVPGTILYGDVQGLPLALTMESVIQSRILGLTDILGSKLKFSYVVITEFNE